MWQGWPAANPQAASGVSMVRSLKCVSHIDADSFVVTVDACPVCGFRPIFGLRIHGEDRGDDFVAEGEQQGGDGSFPVVNPFAVKDKTVSSMALSRR
jgi:flagellar assembly factor FliW